MQSPLTSDSLSMQGIREKVLGGTRISEAEALFLYEKADLTDLEQLASSVREKRYGRNAYYVLNRHINYSNICILDCDFCAFGKRKRDPGAFELSVEEMVEKARTAIDAGATEIHIVGGLHPAWPFQRYLDMLQALRSIDPRVSLKAFTAIEILHLSWVAKKTVHQVLEALKAAGLTCLTGGGAEIFEPSIRSKICRGKETGEEWLSVHRQAHQLDIPSTATLLFGHLETYAHRVDHLRQLRELQDETGGFLALLPLAFQPSHKLSHVPGPTPEAIYRNMAVCRIYLDNFPHIKAYWISCGIEVAAQCLRFGADDLDGTVEEEKIYHMAGVQTPTSMAEQGLQQAIRSAGLEPIRRDGFYRTDGSTRPQL